MKKITKIMVICCFTVLFFVGIYLFAEGQNRIEIQAMHRDITTIASTYTKAAIEIANSLSTDQIEGYEILQEHPTSEEVENLLNHVKDNGWPAPTDPKPVYKYREEFGEADGHRYHICSYVEKYDGDTLVWSVEITDFWVWGCAAVSDGVIAYGINDTSSISQSTYAWMAKIDTDGNLLWIRKMDHGFKDESIAVILEKTDGSYAVISRGELTYFCLSLYSADGEETHFKKTKIGNYGIWDAACFGDGYIVQHGSYMKNEHARIVKVDHEGNITDAFTYVGEDADYYITDMIEHNGNIYLSAYAVPKLADEEQSTDENAAVLNYLRDNGIREISTEELTPMVRDNYTAMLLVCDPTAGTPQEFYAVKGSLGGKLSLSDSGMLLWDVESITITFYSPGTSSFTIGGTSYVFRYTFDTIGELVSQEKTEEIVDYRR